MIIYLKLALASFFLVLSFTLNFNAKLHPRAENSAEANDVSTISTSLRKCIFKHSYFFPVKSDHTSLDFIHPTQNFIRFCHCRENQHLPQLVNSTLSIIDFCSNQHLNAFEHEMLFELNTKLIIEPDISERLFDQLRFVGPFIERTSLIQTQRCMLKKIISDCNKQFSLNRTKKCALRYLNENWLYQNVYKNCHSLKFENKDPTEVNKI